MAPNYGMRLREIHYATRDSGALPKMFLATMSKVQPHAQAEHKYFCSQQLHFSARGPHSGSASSRSRGDRRRKHRRRRQLRSDLLRLGKRSRRHHPCRRHDGCRACRRCPRDKVRATRLWHSSSRNNRGRCYFCRQLTCSDSYRYRRWCSGMLLSNYPQTQCSTAANVDSSSDAGDDSCCCTSEHDNIAAASSSRSTGCGRTQQPSFCSHCPAGDQPSRPMRRRRRKPS